MNNVFYKISKRSFAKSFLFIFFLKSLIFPVFASENSSFEQIIMREISRDVSFNAWGGSPATNQYIQWVAGRVKEKYGIILRHVKLTNTSQAVSRILAEKIAGKTEKGSVDLLWINGENFSRMKGTGLLQTNGWVHELPAFRYVNPEKMPDTVFDFGIPTDGLESPWGRAQFVFGYNSKKIKAPPRSASELEAWIKMNPGKFTYPQPPDFIGTSFLKQLLIQLVDDKDALYQSSSNSDATHLLKPLWEWLNKTHPFMWRNGTIFPSGGSHLLRLLGDGEIDIAMSFNPAEFAYAVEQEILSKEVKSFIFDKGSLANVHFVTIPFNATSPDAAKIVANFLLSPEAQVRKANIKFWGDPTVLDINKLPEEFKMNFRQLPVHQSMLSPEELQNIVPEPHPSWVEVIEEEWQKNYATGGKK